MQRCLLLVVAVSALLLSQQAAGLSCEVEAKAKALLLEEIKQNPSKAPMFLRAVFHDSVDANNLFEKDGDGWKKIEGAHGGVDGCLYSPLKKSKESGKEEPVASHNRNLAPAYQIAARVCQMLKDEDVLRAEAKDCLADMSVLGALVAIEAAGGPSIGMTWGRKGGSCEALIGCTKEDCSEEDKAIGFGPSLTDIDDPGHFRTAFDHLGYDAREQVALMGAHTFGKLQVCAGGMNGIEAGPFCNNPAKIVPALGEANMYKAGDGSSCIPKTGEAKGCWQLGGGSSSLLEMNTTTTTSETAAHVGADGLSMIQMPDVRRLRRIASTSVLQDRKSSAGGAARTMRKAGRRLMKTSERTSTVEGGGGRRRRKEKKSSAALRPVFSKRIEGETSLPENPIEENHVIATGFGDGGFFDQTPEKFDNEYFRTFADQTFADKDNCCGKKKNGGCHRKGTPVNRTSGEKLGKSLCELGWCRSDRKERTHMKSLNLWHEANHDFVKKGWRHGVVKRVIRLAGDWALLNEDADPAKDTRRHVTEFAKDQNAFFEAFKGAFSKVTMSGYAEGDLAVCTAAN